MANRDIVAVGTSAGGVEALMKLVADLPEELPASLFVVQHVSPTAQSVLVDILSSRTSLPVEQASDRNKIQRGCGTCRASARASHGHESLVRYAWA